MRYILDTNIISDLIRSPRGRVSERLDAIPNDELATSIVVAAELRYGVARMRSRSLERKVEDALSAFAVVPLGAPVDVAYGEIRAWLEASGTLIGNNDMLIAAHAVALDCILVTDNVREFSRVDGLAVENWLR